MRVVAEIRHALDTKRPSLAFAVLAEWDEVVRRVVKRRGFIHPWFVHGDAPHGDGVKRIRRRREVLTRGRPRRVHAPSSFTGDVPGGGRVAVDREVLAVPVIAVPTRSAVDKHKLGVPADRDALPVGG